jgi:hypothetical protein
MIERVGFGGLGDHTAGVFACSCVCVCTKPDCCRCTGTGS